MKVETVFDKRFYFNDLYYVKFLISNNWKNSCNRFMCFRSIIKLIIIEKYGTSLYYQKISSCSLVISNFSACWNCCFLQLPVARIFRHFWNKMKLKKFKLCTSTESILIEFCFEWYLMWLFHSLKVKWKQDILSTVSFTLIILMFLSIFLQIRYAC